MNLPLKSVIDEPFLMRLAGERFFERGRKYFAEGLSFDSYSKMNRYPRKCAEHTTTG
jgi:hypothetical protein